MVQEPTLLDLMDDSQSEQELMSDAQMRWAAWNYAVWTEKARLLVACVRVSLRRSPRESAIEHLETHAKELEHVLRKESFSAWVELIGPRLSEEERAFWNEVYKDIPEREPVPVGWIDHEGIAKSIASLKKGYRSFWMLDAN